MQDSNETVDPHESSIPGGNTRPAPSIILDYGHASHAAHYLDRLGPQHLTAFVGFTTLVWYGSIGRTPLWVTVVAAGGLSLMSWVYAQERSARRRGAYWLVTDQLLLAIVLSAGAIWQTLERASHISRPGVWLPYNQTYFLDPTWALEPLRYAAVGAAWFIAVYVSIRLRRRYAGARSRATIAAPPPAARGTPQGSTTPPAAATQTPPA